MYTSTTVRRSDDFFSVRGKSVVPFFQQPSAQTTLSLSAQKQSFKSFGQQGVQIAGMSLLEDYHI